MAIRTELSAQRVLIFRTKSSALLGALAFSILSLVVAAGAFIIAGKIDEGVWIVNLIGIVFGVAAIGIVLRIPKILGQINQHGGVPVLRADRTQIQISPYLNSDTTSIPWQHIKSIVLTPSLKSIEAGETTYHWRNLIVFTHDKPASTSFGGPYTRTGDDSFCLLCTYPKKDGPALVAALKKLAPGNVDITLANAVVFDFKKGENAIQRG